MDTNVLLLHLMDKVDRTQLGQWKRTQQFTAAHAILLDLAVRNARRFVTTPHVLTEVINLSEGVPKRLHDRYWAELKAYIGRARERTVHAKEVARDPDFDPFGLADLAQALISRARPLIITVDSDLTTILERRKLPFVNLNHLAFAAPPQE